MHKVKQMLIEFRVKNFRSLRDEQVLSMVASSDKTMQDSHVFRTARGCSAITCGQPIAKHQYGQCSADLHHA